MGRFLDAIGIKCGLEDFCHRAVARIRSLTRDGERPVGLGGAGIDTTRIYSYAEYSVHLDVPTAGIGETKDIGEAVQGHIFRESGYHGSTTAGKASSVLHAFRLPNSAHVDRSLC